MSLAEKLAFAEENVPKVYEAGRKSEYDAFWDSYQENGNRTHYDTAFAGNGWTNENFKPKYDIKPQRAMYLFRATKISGDVADILEKLGVIMDFSNCTYAIELFSNCFNITRLGIIDGSKFVQTTSAFAFCGTLTTIDKIISSESTPWHSTTFSGCEKLENVIFEGVIGKNGLDLHESPLSHESIMSIITCLQDKTADTSGTVWTVTLGETNLAKLTDAEKLIATNKGWQLA